MLRNPVDERAGNEAFKVQASRFRDGARSNCPGTGGAGGLEAVPHELRCKICETVSAPAEPPAARDNSACDMIELEARSHHGQTVAGRSLRERIRYRGVPPEHLHEGPPESGPSRLLIF